MDSKKPVNNTESVSAAPNNDATTDSTIDTKKSPNPPSAAKISMPKRLISLLIFFVVISVGGLITQQGVLLCILTLFMVLAIIGKQKAGLIMLRVYTSLQLLIVSALPLIVHNPENFDPSAPQSFAIGSFNSSLPDWLIFAILILLAIVQVWIAFTRKVGHYFNREMNLNIMR
ncbi:hypothetical protein Shal_1037 [Shewanella halifaxensis HAW-EB4]|uniref:Uncharacterized protein n=1 Tax=Shewanella halifaxensis (strain HAW-EB4) TaxID=458817 RepID=B0TIR1_SHEHH|nr:hypothetical protein [Shewanella halifaxensis]ABZ75606.1 hypothetical protein Shal_1037 [Shewanella halifaxensis HAW-EB4]